MDVIRKIVLAVRDAETETREVPGITDAVFRFNAMLLIEAGLVLGHVMHDNGRNFTPIPSTAIIWRLTWEGFEFADSITDEALWDKAKRHVIKPAGSWTLDILREVIASLIKESLKL